jgi:hypothetical protein
LIRSSYPPLKNGCRRLPCLPGEARLLAAGCPLDQAEPYGDCLTYGPGHYETWTHWRRDRTVDPALRALVRSYEYEDWPRGRIVFDRARDVFILYADHKLGTPAMIAHIETQFHLPAESTEVKSDRHYQSTEIFLSHKSPLAYSTCGPLNRYRSRQKSKAGVCLYRVSLACTFIHSPSVAHHRRPGAAPYFDAEKLFRLGRRAKAGPFGNCLTTTCFASCAEN